MICGAARTSGVGGLRLSKFTTAICFEAYTLPSRFLTSNIPYSYSILPVIGGTRDTASVEILAEFMSWHCRRAEVAIGRGPTISSRSCNSKPPRHSWQDVTSERYSGTPISSTVGRKLPLLCVLGKRDEERGVLDGEDGASLRRLGWDLATHRYFTTTSVSSRRRTRIVCAHCLTGWG